jgi:hypothetical protein
LPQQQQSAPDRSHEVVEREAYLKPTSTSP